MKVRMLDTVDDTNLWPVAEGETPAKAAKRLARPYQKLPPVARGDRRVARTDRLRKGEVYDLDAAQAEALIGRDFAEPAA